MSLSPTTTACQEVQATGGTTSPVLFDLRQGSREWAEWRRHHVGASDVSAVLGVSLWQTAFGLWRFHTGRCDGVASSYVMNRGKALEPRARFEYERKTGIKMTPACARHAIYSHMGASIDGRNAGLRRSLEIKDTNKHNHALAKNMQVPDEYVPQVQQILFITGDEQLDYMSHNCSTWHIVPVKPDAEYQAMLLREVTKYWELVKSGTPPGMADMDYKALKKSSDPVERALFGYWSKSRKINAHAQSSLLSIYGVAS